MDIDAGSFDDEDLDYRNMMEHMVKQRNRLNPVCVQLNREINDKAKVVKKANQIAQSYNNTETSYIGGAL